MTYSVFQKGNTAFMIIIMNINIIIINSTFITITLIFIIIVITIVSKIESLEEKQTGQSCQLISYIIIISLSWTNKG